MFDLLVAFLWVATVGTVVCGVFALAVSHVDRPWPIPPRPRYRRSPQR